MIVYILVMIVMRKIQINNDCVRNYFIVFNLDKIKEEWRNVQGIMFKKNLKGIFLGSWLIYVCFYFDLIFSLLYDLIKRIVL